MVHWVTLNKLWSLIYCPIPTVCEFFNGPQVKDSLWEGGVRGSAALWSTKIKKRGRVAMQMMNIQDWLPTLYRAAGNVLVIEQMLYTNVVKIVPLPHDYQYLYHISEI